MDWIFELADGHRVFMRARENGSEGRIHVALKLLGLLLLSDTEPEMEPRKGIHHRKYKPDVVSGDGKIWCEAGKVARQKLIEVASLKTVDSLLVMKAGFNAARDLARKFPTGTGTDVMFYGWDMDAVRQVADVVSGHCDVNMHRIVGDDGAGYARYKALIDGVTVILMCHKFRPGCEGDE